MIEQDVEAKRNTAYFITNAVATLKRGWSFEAQHPPLPGSQSHVSVCNLYLLTQQISAHIRPSRRPITSLMSLLDTGRSDPKRWSVEPGGRPGGPLPTTRSSIARQGQRMTGHRYSERVRLISSWNAVFAFHFQHGGLRTM